MMERHAFLMMLSLCCSPAGSLLAGADIPEQAPSVQLGQGFFDTVEFLPDGEHFLTEGAGGVYLWDAETATTVRKLGGLPRNSGGQRFLHPPTDSGFVFLSNDPGLLVWNVQTGASKMMEGTAGNPRVMDTAVSPDGSLAAASFPTNAPANTLFETRVWNAETGEELIRFATAPLLEFSPDNETLFAFGGAANAAALWDARTGGLKKAITLVEWNDRRTHSFAPDGSRFAYAYSTRGINALDMGTLNALPEISIASITQGQYKPNLSFLNDNVRLLVEADGPEGSSKIFRPPVLVVYNTNTGTLIDSVGDETLSHPGYSPFPTVSADRAYFATWAELREEGHIYSADSPTTPSHTINIRPAAISSSGDMISGIDPHSQLHGVWNIETDAPTPLFGVPDTLLELVAFSPDGSMVTAAYRDGYFMQYSTATGALANQFRLPLKSIFSMGYSRDGSKLLVSSGFGKTLLVDATTGAEERRFETSLIDPRMTHSTFLKNGNSALIAFLGWVSGGPGTPLADEVDLAIWDTSTGTRTRQLNSDVLRLESIKLSFDGRYALVMGISTIDPVEIWDLWSGERVWTLAGSGVALRNGALKADFAYSNATVIFYNPAVGNPTLVNWQNNTAIPVDAQLEGLRAFAPLADQDHAIVSNPTMGTLLYSFRTGEFQRRFAKTPATTQNLEMNPVVSEDGTRMLRYSYEGGYSVLYETGMAAILTPEPGDMDGDGAVTPIDAQEAFECYIYGACANPAKALVADYCGDGSVTPSDAQAIFESFLGLASTCN